MTAGLGPRFGAAPFGIIIIALHICVALPAHAQTVITPPQTTDAACEQAGRLAERTHAVPAGLLLAIGRVESGRWDAQRGRVVPWPWAIDVGGDGKLFDSKATAITQTAALRSEGTRNIDVGCFQINLASHPLAFSDLDQAFDPTTNADYAGRFLSELHGRLGNWDNAVAAYHSMQPELGVPYRQLVFANWSLRDRAADGDPHSPGGEVPTGAVPNGPLVVTFASGARLTIWTPGIANAPESPASAPAIAVHTTAVAALPRIVVGKPPLPQVNVGTAHQ
jgi:hypothetical protein